MRTKEDFLKSISDGRKVYYREEGLLIILLYILL